MACGVYLIKQLCDIINENMLQFNINLKLKNNMVYVDFTYYKYWVFQTKQTGRTGKAENSGALNGFQRVSQQSWSKKNKNSDIQIKITLSSKLPFMLGFKKSKLVSTQTE